MIAAEIGEAAGGELHTVEAALVEPVAGGFHRGVRDAGVRQFPEHWCSATGSGVVSEP